MKLMQITTASSTCRISQNSVLQPSYIYIYIYIYVYIYIYIYLSIEAMSYRKLSIELDFEKFNSHFYAKLNKRFGSNHYDGEHFGGCLRVFPPTETTLNRRLFIG